jgi:hypothetical protein
MGVDPGVHLAKLKLLGRHKAFGPFGDYLEFGDPFEGYPLGGVLYSAVAQCPRSARGVSQRPDDRTSHAAPSTA